jgi:hypothetical protein
MTIIMAITVWLAWLLNGPRSAEVVTDWWVNRSRWREQLWESRQTYIKRSKAKDDW